MKTKEGIAACLLLAVAGCGAVEQVAEAALFPEVTPRMRAACDEWIGPNSDAEIASVYSAFARDRANGFSYFEVQQSVLDWSYNFDPAPAFGRQDYVACAMTIADGVYGR